MYINCLNTLATAARVNTVILQQCAARGDGGFTSVSSYISRRDGVLYYVDKNCSGYTNIVGVTMNCVQTNRE